jgi:RNA polymerase sigma factor (sigma-70 family)
MDTDLNLLTRYHREGDAGAFQALLQTHAGMVFAAARRITQDATLAEEVAQDTFLALARRGQSVQKSVAAWLHHVARQKACNALRGKLRRQRHERTAADLLLDKQDASWTEIEPVVDESIDELPDSLRAVLVEHFLEQRTQQEIAQRLGASQSTISRQIESALQMLRDALKQRGVMCGAGLAGLLSAHTAQAAPASLAASLSKIAMTGLGSGAAGVAASSGLLATLSTTTKVVLASAATAAAVAISVPFLRPGKTLPAAAIVSPSSAPESPAPAMPPVPAASISKSSASPAGSLSTQQLSSDDKELILAEFRRMGGSLTATGEDWLTKDIDNVIQKNFKNDRAAFERDLEKKGQTLEQFRTQRSEMAIISIMKARITKGITDPAEKLRAVENWLLELRVKSNFSDPAPKPAPRPAVAD